MKETENTAQKTGTVKKTIILILLFILFSAIYFVITGIIIYSYEELSTIICSAITALLCGAETLILRRIKAPKYILFPAVLIPEIVILADTLIGESHLILIHEIAYTLLICAVLCSIRCFVAAIDSIAAKRKISAVCLIVATAIICSSGIIINVNDRKINDMIVEYLEGVPDQTSSWNAINQEVVRDKNWKQIVKNSEFQLGEIKSSRQPENDYDDYDCTWGTYPLMDGSTVCVPMAVEFARQHLGFDDENSRYFTEFNTTHYAYERLINKVSSSAWFYNNDNSVYLPDKIVDLIIGTEPSDDELAMAKNAGVELIKKPVCYDAFVFITHKDNPVESLTVDQIKDIYSGKIKNWKEVGGNDEKIVAYQREANSGSQTAMENLVMGGANMIDPITIKVIEGMGTLVDAVAEYDNKTASLGYTYRYYIDTLYKNDNIKTIAVDGISPTDDNIRSEKYPFTTNYYGVIRHGDENKTGGKFLDWMLTDGGQQCIAQAGYITIYESDDMVIKKLTDAVKNIRTYIDKGSADAKLKESTLNILSDKVKKYLDSLLPECDVKSEYTLKVDLTDKKDLSNNILQLDFQLEAKFIYESNNSGGGGYAEPIRIQYDRSTYKIVSYKVEGKGGYFGV